MLCPQGGILVLECLPMSLCSLNSYRKGKLPFALDAGPPSSSSRLVAHSHGSSQHPGSSLPQITSKDSWQGMGVGQALEIQEGFLFHLSGHVEACRPD